MHDTIPGEIVQFVPEKITLRSESEEIWQIPVRFYDANPQGRVLIDVPGFRSPSVDDPTNIKLYNALAAKNISVLAFNYSGCNNFEDAHDPATLETHIADLKEVMALTAGREHDLLSHSFGLIPALAAANENTSSIIAATPVPYLFTENGFNIERRLYKALVRRKIDRQGYIYSKKQDAEPGTVPFKLTREFEESAAREERRILYLAGNTRHSPPIKIIIHDQDKYLPLADAKSLQAIFLRNNFPCEMHIIEGNRHRLLPQTIEKIVDVAAAGIFQQELALA